MSIKPTRISDATSVIIFPMLPRDGHVVDLQPMHISCHIALGLSIVVPELYKVLYVETR